MFLAIIASSQKPVICTWRMYKLNAAYVSIIVPLLVYLIFICIILKFSIPLKSHINRTDLTPILEFWKKKKSEMKDTVIEVHESDSSLPPVQLLTVIFNK